MFALRQEVRQPLPCGEPKPAGSVARRGQDFAGRQSVGGCEVFDLSSRRCYLIHSPPGAHVDSAVKVIGNSGSNVAGQSLLGRIVDEGWAIGVWLIDAADATARRRDPEPACIIQVKIIDPSRWQTVLGRKEREASAA